MASRDQWATWLLERRFAGGRRDEVMEQLGRFRDRVLDNAQLVDGETLLDVGCGEGLIAFGALDRGAAMVIFSDVSRDLLDVCRSAAAELDLFARCRRRATRAPGGRANSSRREDHEPAPSAFSNAA